MFRDWRAVEKVAEREAAGWFEGSGFCWRSRLARRIGKGGYYRRRRRFLRCKRRSTRRREIGFIWNWRRWHSRCTMSVLLSDLITKLTKSLPAAIPLCRSLLWIFNLRPVIFRLLILNDIFSRPLDASDHNPPHGDKLGVLFSLLPVARVVSPGARASGVDQAFRLFRRNISGGRVHGGLGDDGGFFIGRSGDGGVAEH